MQTFMLCACSDSVPACDRDVGGPFAAALARFFRAADRKRWEAQDIGERHVVPKTKSSEPKAGAKAKPRAAAKRAAGASRQVDQKIQSLGGWRAETLAEIRRLIHEAAPDIVEDCKWIKPSNPLGVPVWSHAGIVCTGEAYKQVVKLTFARGASLMDPEGLFNASLEGGTRRAIDIREGESLDAAVFKALIRSAAAQNQRVVAKKSP